jgi:hypothetical protein
MKKNQFKILLKKVIDNDIINIKKSSKYLKLLDSVNKKDSAFIPILDYSSKKGDYKKYHSFLIERIDKIKQFIAVFIQRNDTNMIINLDWIDTIILYFIIRIIDEGKYSDITINDIYDIIHIYHKMEDSNEIEEYKIRHYRQIEYLSQIWGNISSQFPNMRFLYDHHISYTSEISEYKIYNIINIVGYNDTDIVLFKLKPQFSSLNYNEVLIESIYNHYLIRNTRGDINNHERFNGKNIKTCVLSLDLDKPYYIKWDDNNDDFIKSNLYQNMKKYYISQIYLITIFYNHFYGIYEEKPKMMLDKMNESFSKLNQRNIPNFIKEWFSDIKCRTNILQSKKDKIDLLNEKHNMIKKDLELKIDDELKIFFNLQDQNYEDY